MSLVRSAYMVALLCIYIMSLSSNSIQAVDPDDENSTYLDTFLEKLDEYSGLSSLEPKDRYQVATTCSSYNPCIVNANGTILWDVRFDLYDSQMSDTINSQMVNEISLNGCLTLQTSSEYNECMITVRNNMITFLEQEFEDRFGLGLAEDCESLGPDNCITIDQTSSK